MLELLLLGTFAPGRESSIGWNFRSLELSFPGAKVPWNFRSLQLSFPGTFAPRSESSMELSLRGTLFPALSLPGAKK